MSSSFGETAGSTMDRLNRLLSSIHSSPLDDSREIKLHALGGGVETTDGYDREKDPLLQYFGKLKTNLKAPPNQTIEEPNTNLLTTGKLQEERSQRIRQLLDSNVSTSNSNNFTERVVRISESVPERVAEQPKGNSFDERIARISRKIYQNEEGGQETSQKGQLESRDRSPQQQTESLSSRTFGIKVNGIKQEEQSWGRQLAESLERSPTNKKSPDRKIPLSSRINAIKLNGFDQSDTKGWGREVVESLERSPTGTLSSRIDDLRLVVPDGGVKSKSSQREQSWGRQLAESLEPEQKPLLSHQTGEGEAEQPLRSDTPTDAFINMLRSSSTETAKHQEKQSGLDSLFQSLQKDVNNRKNDFLSDENAGQRSHSQSANRLLADIQNDIRTPQQSSDSNRYVSRLSQRSADSRTLTPAPLRSATVNDQNRQQPAVPPERSATAPSSTYTSIPMFSDLVKSRNDNKEGEGFTALLHKLHDEENRSGTVAGTTEVIDVDWSDLADGHAPDNNLANHTKREIFPNSHRERYAGSPVECSPASAQDCEGLTALLEKLHREDEEEEQNAGNSNFRSPNKMNFISTPSNNNERAAQSPSNLDRVMQWGHRMEQNMHQREENRRRRLTQKELQDEEACPFKPKINNYSNKVARKGCPENIEKRTANIIRAKERRLESQRRDLQNDEQVSQQPIITRKAKQMTRTNGSRMQWDAFRKIKLEQQQAGQEQDELQSCTFQPSLSERSRCIAKKKELKDRRVPLTTPTATTTSSTNKTFRSTPKAFIRTPLQNANPSAINSGSNRASRATVDGSSRKPNLMPKRTPSPVSTHNQRAIVEPAKHLSADDWWSQAIRVQRSELWDAVKAN